VKKLIEIVIKMPNYNTPYCFFAAKSDKPKDEDTEGEFDEDALTEDYGIVRLPPLVPENQVVPEKSKHQQEIDAALKRYLDNMENLGTRK
jgi:hypothetical protein